MTNQLSEAKRKEIFKEIAEAEIRADEDADKQYPRPDSSSPGYTDEKYSQVFNQMMLASWELDFKYKSDVARKHGLSKLQITEISVEGVKKKWPGCGELDPKRNHHGKVSDPAARKRDWELFQKRMANARVEVLGVHPVGKNVPCMLVELIVHGSDAPLNMLEFKQEKPSYPPDGYQVPYLEHILDRDGVTSLANYYTLDKDSELWKGDVRLTFFMHFLDPFLPLKTPLGYVLLPEATALPDRLKMIKYEPVD